MVVFYRHDPYERYYMENEHGWWEWTEEHPVWTSYWNYVYESGTHRLVKTGSPASYWTGLQGVARCSRLEVLVNTGLSVMKAGNLEPVVA